jgi:hypothetical protein
VRLELTPPVSSQDLARRGTIVVLLALLAAVVAATTPADRQSVERGSRV